VLDLATAKAPSSWPLLLEAFIRPIVDVPVKPILDVLVKRVGQVVAGEAPRSHLPPSFIAARTGNRQILAR
jgi:hypothetical protein